jgi:hypothetical protein
MSRSRWDFKRPFCEVCGKTGGWYTQEGWTTCEEHWRSPKPERPTVDSVTGERINDETDKSQKSVEAEGDHDEE